MRSDIEVNSHVLYKWTVARLDSYAARVAENRGVEEALDFAKWVINSRLPQVLAHHSCEDGQGGLKVDAALLRWKAEEVQRACQERYRLNDSKPHVEALQLQSIHEKLNLVAGYLSRLVVVDAGGAVTSPQLKVISGGLEEAAGVSEEHNASA